MFLFKLEEALNELGITKNKLSVESKVRSNTIIDLAKGSISRIDFYSLQSILDTLNMIARNKGMDRKFDLNDIVQYDFESQGKYYIKVDPSEFETDEEREAYLQQLTDLRMKELLEFSKKVQKNSNNLFE